MASRRASGRSSRSGWAISNGSLQDRLHLLRLTPDAVRRRRGAGTGVREGERGGGFQAACDLADIEWVDEDAGAVGDELGRPAHPRRHDAALARHRLEQRLAERLDQRGPANDVRRAEPARHLTGRDAADHPDARNALETRPVPPAAYARPRAPAPRG